MLKVNEAARVPQILRTAPRHPVAAAADAVPRAGIAAERFCEQARRIEDFGYRCWTFESPLFNPQNFNRRSDDIFPGRLALVLLAVPEERDSDAAIAGVDGLIPVSI